MPSLLILINRRCPDAAKWGIHGQVLTFKQHEPMLQEIRISTIPVDADNHSFIVEVDHWSEGSARKNSPYKLKAFETPPVLVTSLRSRKLQKGRSAQDVPRIMFGGCCPVNVQTIAVVNRGVGGSPGDGRFAIKCQCLATGR